jgi:ABC-type Fe3+-hydroxamate transport system substrate-binding protein
MLVGATETEFYISTEVSGRCAIINEVASCPWADSTSGESWSYTTSIEGLLQLDPDIIIVDNWGSWSDEEMETALAANPLWNEVTAVKEDRVIPILELYSYVQGIGPIGNLRFLDLYVPLFYPEIFDGPLTDEEVEEILAR